MTMYSRKLKLQYLHQTTSKSHVLKIYDPVLKWDIFPKLVRIILFSLVIFITVFSFNWYYVDTGQLLDIVVVQKLENKTFSHLKENYLINKEYAVEKELHNLDNFHRVRFISMSADANNFHKTNEIKTVAKQPTEIIYFSKVNNPKSKILHQKLLGPELVITAPTLLETEMLNLQKCEQHLNADRLTTGKSGTAFNCYQQVLLSNPTNVIAKEGLVKIGLRYENWAKVAINKGAFNKALSYIKSLQKVNPQSSALPKLNYLLKRSKKALVKKNTQRKLLSSSNKKKIAKRSSHTHTTKKISKRCDNIFSQESLGIRALTSEQTRFKRISCK